MRGKIPNLVSYFEGLAESSSKVTAARATGVACSSNNLEDCVQGLGFAACGLKKKLAWLSMRRPKS